ncbi:GNAT family N-acetyltransferase [Nocardia sp. NPDC051570]|uniref:GNAT family N-acetyltransferase n=1 Tax=Nocardia sp. NPDC051570 TaxID=3364324 RepID=UPI0037AB1288
MSESTVLPVVRLCAVTAETAWDVFELSETLSAEQRNMVADNAESIAEAHFSDRAWYRAISADGELAGFLMLHVGADEEIDCPGVFLWRLMIAGPYQGRGIGRRVIESLVEYLRTRGIHELHASHGDGPGSPESFYTALGFVPTGEHYGEDHEVGVVLRW